MRYFSRAQSTVHLSSVLLAVSMVLGPDNPDDEVTTDQYPHLCYSVIPVCYYTALFVLAACMGNLLVERRGFVLELCWNSTQTMLQFQCLFVLISVYPVIPC